MFRVLVFSLLFLITTITWADAPQVIAKTTNQLPVQVVKDGSMSVLLTFQRDDMEKIDSNYSVNITLDQFKLPEGWHWLDPTQVACPDNLSTLEPDVLGIPKKYPCKIWLTYTPKTLQPTTVLDIPYTITLTQKGGLTSQQKSHLTIPFQAIEKWAMADIKRPPLIDNHRHLLYVYNENHHLIALNFDGVEQWRFPITIKDGNNQWALGANGSLYVASEKDVYAFTPDGHIKWQLPIPLGHHPSLFMSPQNKFYLSFSNGSKNSLLQAIGLEGQILSHIDLPGYVSDMSFGKEGDVYAILNTYMYFDMYVLTSQLQEKSWHKKTMNYLMAPTVASDGTLYSMMDGILYALSLDGEPKWSYPDVDSFFKPVVDHQGNIYVKKHSSESLVALTPDGQQKWVAHPLWGVTAEQAVIHKDGLIYVAALDWYFSLPTMRTGMFALRKLLAIDPTNGHILHTYTLGYDNHNIIKFDESGTLYVNSGRVELGNHHRPTDNSLYAISESALTNQI